MKLKKGVPENLFKELYDVISYIVKKIVMSRLFVVAILFLCMFGALVWKLFDLQIRNNEYYQEKYIQKTLHTIQTESTRGEIYDRNGKLLAYNELTYSVTMTDIGAYANGYERNKMLLKLIAILDSHGETIESAFPMAIDENGNLKFTTTSASEKTTLLRNIYGMTKDDVFDDVNSKGEIINKSDPTPEEFLKMAKHRFGIGEERNNENAYEVDDATAIKMLHIRYAMYLKSFRRYDSTVIARNVSQETVTDVLEHANVLLEIGVEEDTKRVYNYAKYFAHIIGYTGKASEEELAALQAEDSSYESGDLVGKTGIEQVMEQELSGTKGSTTMFLDSEGRVLDVIEEETVDPVAGDDIYLSVDADLTMGVYHLLEQKLAAILHERIVNYDFEIPDNFDTTQIKIPVKDAYFQLINNNVLSMDAFAREDASDVEKQIYTTFLTRQGQVLDIVRKLLTADTTSYQNLIERQQDYSDFISYYLRDNGYMTITDEMRADSTYQTWVARNCSLREFLYYAVSKNWIDTSQLDLDEKYSTTDTTYAALTVAILHILENDDGFSKLIYKYMIEDEALTGRDVCLSLFYQGVLKWNDADVTRLLNGGRNTSYAFFMEKIKNIEITPEQLALDPCTASCVLLNVQTGEPLAVVTYPGYDNNYMSGTVNAAYYRSLLQNLSNPLYNNATQTRTAPGSTFKIISAIAGLEEGLISTSETIEDLSVFTKQGLNLRCWMYPGTHGHISVAQAIRDSCNYFFCEIGFRLSSDSAGKYNEPRGLAMLEKYASMFGLNEKSGLEIAETSPHISTTGPIPSSIGQGSHNFSNIHLARYVAAVANRGTLYDLTLLSKRTDFEGNLLETYASEVANTVDLASSTWNAVHRGMRMVIENTSAIFDSCTVTMAGKTGTAEESEKRGPHATFIGFAPYENPEVSVSVVIPFGYASTYSAEVSRDVINYYYGATTLEQILSQGASSSSGVTIHD